MKKTSSLFILLFLTSSVISQVATPTSNPDIKRFAFGLHLAPSVDWLKPNALDYSSAGSIIGFSWGLHAEYRFGENYGLLSGLDFRSTGGMINYPEQIVNSGTTYMGSMHRQYHLKYIEIPLTIKMSTNSFGNFNFWGKFGLGLGCIIGAKSDDKFTANSGTVFSSTNNDITSQIATFKTSLIIGLGVDYKLIGKTRMVVGIIFDNGFSDVLSGKNKKDPSISEKANANQMELNLGITF